MNVNAPVITPLIACLLLQCCWAFGTIAQKLVRACPDVLMLLCSQAFLFFCPLTSFLSLVFMCWGRGAPVSHRHHLDERWSHHRPRPITAAPPQVEGGGRVLPWRPHQIGQNETSHPKTLTFFFLYSYSDMLIYQQQHWRWWKGGGGWRGGIKL